MQEFGGPKGEQGGVTALQPLKSLALSQGQLHCHIHQSLQTAVFWRSVLCVCVGTMGEDSYKLTVQIM